MAKKIIITDEDRFTGEAIRYYRKLCDISQEELAFRIDSTAKYIGMLERTKALPSVRMARKIANALTVDPALLVRPEKPGEEPLEEFNLSRLQEAFNRKSIAEKRVIIRMLEGMLLYEERQEIADTK